MNLNLIKNTRINLIASKKISANSIIFLMTVLQKSDLGKPKSLFN